MMEGYASPLVRIENSRERRAALRRSGMNHVTRSVRLSMDSCVPEAESRIGSLRPGTPWADADFGATSQRGASPPPPASVRSRSRSSCSGAGSVDTSPIPSPRAHGDSLDFLLAEHESRSSSMMMVGLDSRRSAVSPDDEDELSAGWRASVSRPPSSRCGAV
eukprot:TRINITY_DN32197_c0_g1_i1.p2 TRINITY_DN32197_c0_g1~~TRINITY_DN32197_c0_g1_i1.p2  ORF type:complete len:162 (-),score=5.54 TRINITY_DN32197_c0_g1_i1:41-526(-)